MFETEKLLYEKAGVTAKECCERDSDLCMSCCPKWNERQSCWKYMRLEPCFTVEKQLELIKFLLKFGSLKIEDWEERGYNLTYNTNSYNRNITYDSITRATMEEALAQIIIDVWEDLTNKEKEEIKGILK